MRRHLHLTRGIETLESRTLLSTYYLSPGGDDAAAGTLDAPWRTLATAVSRVAAGDEIVLRSGTYAGGVQVRQPNVTIRSYEGERASVVAPTNDPAVENCIKFRRVPDGKLINLDISGGYYYGVMADGSWGWSTDDADFAGRLLVEGCRIYGTGRDAIKITPGVNDVVIRGNEIYNTGVRDSSNAEGIDNVNGDGMLVQDNYFHDIATNGVYAKGGASGAVIERNRIERTGSLGITLGFTTDGEFFDADNTGGYESIDGTVRNNLIIGPRYGGIGLYSAIGAKVYNNTVLNAANQGQAGIVIAPGWEYNPTGRLVPTRDAEIVNNVIGVSGPYPLVQIRADGLDPSGTLLMANNRYFRQGPAADDFRDDRGGARWTGTLAQWQAHVGTDANSTLGDPRVGGDGRPADGSPLVDAGADLSARGFADDLHGNPRVAGLWDVGAVEAPAGPQQDVVAPTINGVRASDLTATSAVLTWTTDEPATSQAEFGRDAAYGSTTELRSSLATQHSVVLTGLLPGTTYHFRVLSRDAAGNGAASADFSLTTAPPNVWLQTSAADFRAGSVEFRAAVQPGGEVRLNRIVADGFGRTTLGPYWQNRPWEEGKSLVTLDAGRLSVAGAQVASVATFPAVAVQGLVDFGATPHSQFGIATDLADPSGSSILFSTEDTTDTLFARVVAGGAATVSKIGPVPDGMHMYHVQPVQGGFAFCVDNVVAATVPVAVPAGDFRAVVSTRDAAGDALVVDAVNVKAYHARAQFISSVFDAGRSAAWGTASWTGEAPAGTQIVVETSSGNTATVDGSWSSWSAVGTDGSVASPPGRYLRYRVTLVTADPTATPVLRDVSVRWY